MSVLLEVDNESPLPKLLEGRTIAFLGGPSSDSHTSEAREPPRRNDLHAQLLQARQLRASLEYAAERAEALSYDDPASHAESVEILQSSLGEINQLVRLTEVLRGNTHDRVTTVGDVIIDGGEHDIIVEGAGGGGVLEGSVAAAKHDEWNGWITNRNALKEEQRNREKRILRRKLREFAKEHNPGVEIDNELEGRHDALIPKPKEEDANVSGGTGVEGWTAESDLYATNDIMLSDQSEAENETDNDYIPTAPPSVLYAESSEWDEDMMAAETSEQSSAAERKRSKGRRSKKRAQTTITDVISQITNIDKDGNEFIDEDDMPMRSLVRKNRSTKRKAAGRSNEETGTNRPIDLTSQASSLSQHQLLAPAAKKMKADDTKQPAASPGKKKAATLHVIAARKKAYDTSSTSAKKSPSGSSAKPYSVQSPASSATAKTKTHVSASTVKATTTKRSYSKSSTTQPRAAKKCHDCKKSTTRHRNCNYYNVTGSKCKKVYCIECLQTKYTLGDDVKSPANPGGVPIENIVHNSAYDAEWHCPACLGTCMCKSCVNVRKREGERERSRNEARQRKSSRRGGGGDRSAAGGGGNAYGYFY